VVEEEVGAEEVWLRGATCRATAVAVSVGRNPKLFRGE